MIWVSFGFRDASDRHENQRAPTRCGDSRPAGVPVAAGSVTPQPRRLDGVGPAELATEVPDLPAPDIRHSTRQGLTQTALRPARYRLGHLSPSPAVLAALSTRWCNTLSGGVRGQSEKDRQRSVEDEGINRVENIEENQLVNGPAE